jgi:hypothetical protein
VDDWITTADAAELSRYHPDYVRKLLQTGKVHGRKFASVWQVSSTSLLNYLRKVEALGKRRGPRKKSFD